jgi:hypothetical protein
MTYEEAAKQAEAAIKVTYEEAVRHAEAAWEESMKAHEAITDAIALAAFLDKKYEAWHDLAEVLKVEEENKVIR